MLDSIVKENGEFWLLCDVRALVQLLCYSLVFPTMVVRRLLQFQPLMSLHDSIQVWEGKDLLFTPPFFKIRGEIAPQSPLTDFPFGLTRIGSCVYPKSVTSIGEWD